METTEWYIIGRFHTGWFRGQLNDCKMAGYLDFIETKGLLECRFSVKAKREVHQVLCQELNKLNSC